MGYTLDKVNAQTTRIIDKDRDAIFLIEGADTALLIDTGMDTEQLDRLVKMVTAKPVQAVLTHGHIDHIGRTGEFDQVFLHPADREMYEVHCHFHKGHFNSDSLFFKPLDQVQDMPECFELGGNRIDVVPLAGHTAGSVLLVDSLNKTVYTGDAIGSGCGCWMQLEGCLPIGEYRTSLNRTIKDLEKMGVDESWKFFGGHDHQEYESRVSAYNRLDLKLMKDMLGLCDRLLDGSAELKPEKVMSVPDCQPCYCCYGKAEMIVTKENIY